MRRRHRLVPATLISLALLSAPALADIYRYVDENGTVHFTNVPEDGRYKLYLTTKKKPDALAATIGPRFRHYPVAKRNKYHEQVVAAAQAYQVEPALIHAVISAESGYNPLARSPKGAQGLMQLMPATAQRYGVKNPLDPKQNIMGGAAYLRDLLTLFSNDMKLAVAAYNAGEGSVMQYGNRIPPYRETTQYVPKVLSYYSRYKSLM